MELPRIESWLTYSAVRRLANTHSIRQVEVPTEYFVSLPLPTLRYELPAFACFAAASARLFPPSDSDKPLQVTYEHPDRWWLFSARSEQLLQYSQYGLQPFTDQPLYNHIVVQDSRSLTEVRQLVKRFEESMNRLIPAFFQQTTIDKPIREEVLDGLTKLVIAEHMPVYEQLTPDFFQYLRL